MMSRDKKPLIVEEDFIDDYPPHLTRTDQPGDGWIAVDVRNKDNKSGKSTPSLQASSGASSLTLPTGGGSRSNPFVISSSSGHQVGFDMAMASPPLQDTHLTQKLDDFASQGRCVTPTEFQQTHLHGIPDVIIRDAVSDTPLLNLPQPTSLPGSPLVISGHPGTTQAYPGPPGPTQGCPGPPGPIRGYPGPPGSVAGSSGSRQLSSLPASDSGFHPSGTLTVPLYQGGFGKLRPGLATNRNDLTYSVTANYYGDSDPHNQSIAGAAQPKKSQVKQSKRMPNWMRVLITELVGAKTRDGGRPIIGTASFVLTITLGLLYVCTHTVFLIYNARSSKTTLTTIEASLQTLNCFFGTSLGFYANRLAVKLFGNQKLLDSIRMHTKSVLKVRASTWAFILIIGFLAADFYDRYMEILKNPFVPATDAPAPSANGTEPSPTPPAFVTSCENVGLAPIVCQIDVYARLAFSAFAGTWNLMVLMVILSICRTHTVGIRRFIKELEKDGRIIENHYRNQVMDMNADAFSVMMHEVNDLNADSDDEYDFEGSWGDDRGQDGAPLNNPVTHHTCREIVIDNLSGSNPNLRSDVSRMREPSLESREQSNILSVNDILLRYYSINSRLSLTGLVIQRWVTCWIIFVIFWVAQMIVYWIKNETQLQEIFLIGIPLILLPLLCSALSEVNFEGDRLVRRLCPTSERLQLMVFFIRSPLHLTIYGQTVRFGNMSNGLIGLATALFTGIAINQFMKTSPNQP